jgi:hypothetical protein
VRDERVVHGNDDENGDDYNAVDRFCDGNAGNFYVRDNVDKSYGASEDVDPQMPLLRKITGKLKRRLLFSF